MLISVVIPTLNEEKLLERLLLQLTDEKVKLNFNYEIIISDGGSKDKTLEIAKKYGTKIVSADPNIKQNISMGRNGGGFAANGDVIVFFNADIQVGNVYGIFDYITNTFYKSKFLAMTCDVRIHPSEEKFIDKAFHLVYNRYLEVLNYVGIGMGRGECHIVRKEIFHQLKGYDERLAAGEDFDLFRRIRKIGKIVWVRRFKVYESPRRYRKYGYLAVWWMWSRNAFSVMLSGKSFDQNWEEVR